MVSLHVMYPVAMEHSPADMKESRNPFKRYPVIGYRIEEGAHIDERFFILEFDPARDEAIPRTFPLERSEAGTRARLTELGLSSEDIEARMAWCKKWMATRVVSPGGAGRVLAAPPL